MMDDSAALKTLAFVTFTFLPPTFICAVFSMSFFNYDQSLGWRVSGKFWVYWAVTVPTTIISAALWFYWQRNPPSRRFQDRVDAFSRGLDHMGSV
jgi:Mg2+ and Co2+ transporter CorA